MTTRRMPKLGSRTGGLRPSVGPEVGSGFLGAALPCSWCRGAAGTLRVLRFPLAEHRGGPAWAWSPGSLRCRPHFLRTGAAPPPRGPLAVHRGGATPGTAGMVPLPLPLSPPCDAFVPMCCAARFGVWSVRLGVVLGGGGTPIHQPHCFCSCSCGPLVCGVLPLPAFCLPSRLPLSHCHHGCHLSIAITAAASHCHHGCPCGRLRGM